jgi:hypothetical protein
MARQQGGRPAAVFYPFGYPSLYAYGCLFPWGRTSALNIGIIQRHVFDSFVSGRKVNRFKVKPKATPFLFIYGSFVCIWVKLRDDQDFKDTVTAGGCHD